MARVLVVDDEESVRLSQGTILESSGHDVIFAPSGEAAMKAFNVRGENRFRFKDIEVRRKPTGKPWIYLTPACKKRFGVPARSQIELSMSHEREYAVATVVLVSP